VGGAPAAHATHAAHGPHDGDAGQQPAGWDEG